MSIAASSRPVLRGYYTDGKRLAEVVGYEAGAVELEDSMTEVHFNVGTSVFRVRWTYVRGPVAAEDLGGEPAGVN